jgi:hypothetical protein
MIKLEAPMVTHTTGVDDDCLREAVVQIQLTVKKYFENIR